MASSSQSGFERPVPLRSTDHQVVERIDARPRPDRVMSRFFCRACQRQENALAWFVRDRCPDA